MSVFKPEVPENESFVRINVDGYKCKPGDIAKIVKIQISKGKQYYQLNLNGQFVLLESKSVTLLP
jgi:hypothetical protein